MSIEIHRRLGEQEISSIITLAKIVESFDGHKALEDHTWLDLVQGGRKGLRGLIAVSVSPPSTLGYAQISVSGGSWAIELLIHPKERNSTSEVGPKLLRAAIEEIRAQGGGHLHMWIAKPTELIEDLAISAGLRRGRDLHHMRRELPLPDSASSSRSERSSLEKQIRTFRVGSDEEEWLEVNNRAFSWHPEQGGWSLETLISRESESWFDPSGFFLLLEQGKIASFCWTKIHSDDFESVGEIYVIGTDPDHTGKGLGETICKFALNYLHSVGMNKAMLYVDATNTGAIALYKKLGFTVDHIDRAYTADIS